MKRIRKLWDAMDSATYEDAWRLVWMTCVALIWLLMGVGLCWLAVRG